MLSSCVSLQSYSWLTLKSDSLRGRPILFVTRLSSIQKPSQSSQSKPRRLCSNFTEYELAGIVLKFYFCLIVRVMIGLKSRAEEPPIRKKGKPSFDLQARMQCPALNGGFLLSLSFWLVRLFEYLFSLARVVTAVLHSSWVWNFGKTADFVWNVLVLVISTFELHNCSMLINARRSYSFLTLTLSLYEGPKKS